MLSDLNDYLLNDLSLLVIEYVKFSDKQLSLLMDQEMDSWYCFLAEMRCPTKDEQHKLMELPGSRCSCARFKQDSRLSIVYGVAITGGNERGVILMVNTSNFSKQVDITKAGVRMYGKKKHSVYFHGSTIIVADDDNNFRVFDYDSDFT